MYLSHYLTPQGVVVCPMGIDAPGGVSHISSMTEILNSVLCHTLPSYPFPFHSYFSLYSSPKFPEHSPRGQISRMSPVNLLKFNMRFGAIWQWIYTACRFPLLFKFVGLRKNFSLHWETIITYCLPSPKYTMHWDRIVWELKTRFKSFFNPCYY